MSMHKFLIVRFSSIGDIVLTTPVIRNLKKKFPESEIHFATKIQYRTLVEHNPSITRCHYLADNWQAFMEILQREKFTHVIDLHNNLRTKRLKFSLKAKSSTFNKLNFKKWLLVNLKINKLPKIHIVDRYMETITHFGVSNDNKGLDFFISEEDKIELAEFDAVFQNGYIAIVVAAKHTTKRLPNEKLVELVNKIEMPVILLGGVDDRSNADIIISKTEKNKSHIYNACGHYNISQSASFIQQADKVITHDTGLMHIAAAFKKPIISIWGNTVPEFGMYPYLPVEKQHLSEIKQVETLSCRPCSKIGHQKCPKGHFKCMKEIDLNKFNL